MYPIAFIEFSKDADGNVTREGPRREKEELAAQDAWAVSFWIDITLILLTLVQRKREREYQRLRKEAEDKQKLFLDWAQRFEVKSGGPWNPMDDGAFQIFHFLSSNCIACRGNA